MFEAIEIIKKLFAASIAGKDVKHQGQFYKMETTRLWTMPEDAPPIFVATAGPDHRQAGRPARRRHHHRRRARWRRSAACSTGSTRAPARPARTPTRCRKVLQLHLSWAATDEEALANAMTEWPNGGMKFPKADIRSPFDFEQMAKLVRPEDFEGRMVI